MNGVSQEKPHETKLEMNAAVEGNLSPSTHNVVFWEKENLTLERGNPLRSVALEKENPLKGVSCWN